MYHTPGGLPQYVFHISFAVGRFGQSALIWLSISGVQVETAIEFALEDDGLAVAAALAIDVSVAFMLLSCIEAANKLKSTNALSFIKIDFFTLFPLFVINNPKIEEYLMLHFSTSVLNN